MNNIPDEFYQDLADAIVLDAVTEWRKAKFQLTRPSLASKTALDKSRQCERFFLSSWFEMLTGLDGKLFLRRLKEGFGFA